MLNAFCASDILFGQALNGGVGGGQYRVAWSLVDVLSVVTSGTQAFNTGHRLLLG